MIELDADTATRRRTKARILEATTRLLTAGQPLTKLSIQRIAKTAGISRATFYLHFGSKHELMSLLARQTTSPWTRLAASALENAELTWEDVANVVRGAIEVYREHRGVLAGIIEMAEYDPETRAAWRETMHEMARLFQTAIEQRRPHLTSPQAQCLSRTLVWGGERFLHQELSPSASERDDASQAWALAEMAWKFLHD